MDDNGLDGIFIKNIENIRYFSGFTGSSAYLIIGRDERVFLTDSRYTTQARDEVNGFTIKEYKEIFKDISLVVDQLNISVFGFEGAHLSFETYHKLRGSISPAVVLKSVEDRIDDLRMVKDSDEVEVIEKAAEISYQALLNIVPFIKDGVREKDIALELDYRMRKLGAESSAFDTIVTSGIRTALPHGKPSEKKIAQGDLVMIDFGSVWKGYSCDETCTFCLGEYSEKGEKIYAVVKNAHDRAIEMIMPGVKASDIDKAARDVIESAGFGRFFGHGTGHGVGINVHEKPAVSRNSDIEIKEGMIFSVEPAIYLPDWGGVRIEDTVLVTADGSRLLTKMPKDKRILN